MQNDYLSQERTNANKGILAICVLIHHIYQHSGIGKEIYIISACLQLLGSFAVAIFFFYSGYGLMVQYKKNSLYIKCFLKHRIIPFYGVYLCYVLIYVIYNILLKQPISPYMIVKSLTFSGTIVLNGWYMQVILLIYILFFAIFKYCKYDWSKILCMSSAICIYSAICIAVGIGSSWYLTIYSVIVGMIWAEKKNEIDKYLSSKRNYILILFATLIFFMICMILSKLINNIIIKQIMMMLAFASFSCMFIELSIKVRVNNRITSYLGTISLSVYLLQGIFLDLFENYFINSKIIYAMATCVCTICAAIILQPFINMVNRYLKNLKIERRH